MHTVLNLKASEKTSAHTSVAYICLNYWHKSANDAEPDQTVPEGMKWQIQHSRRKRQTADVLLLPVVVHKTYYMYALSRVVRFYSFGYFFQDGPGLCFCHFFSFCSK